MRGSLLEVAMPSQPMCVTCCTSVGHPISMSISISSYSSFSTAHQHNFLTTLFNQNLQTKSRDEFYEVITYQTIERNS